MKNSISAIIEARSTSSRLKRKHLLKVKNKSMLEYLVNRLKKIKKLNSIILATRTNRKDDDLVKEAKKLKIKIFRGDEENVTKRVLDCAKKFKVKIILETMGDCPIIDFNLLEQLINSFLINEGFDYANNGQFGLPNGMGCQIFTTKALAKSYKNIKRNDEYEHVSLNIRRNKKIFKHLFLYASQENYWPELGVTLDEFKDFIFLKKIIINFEKEKNTFFKCSEMIQFLKKNKNLLNINKKVFRKQKNLKLNYNK